MLFSFWSGRSTWMERLSVASAKAVGQEITVFTYGNMKKLAAELGCVVLDAASVFSDPSLDELFSQSKPHFSDHFRLEGMAKGYGTWVDLDVIFVRPLPNSDYIFGWQGPDRIGNSVLRLPPESELLKRYLGFCRRRPMRHFTAPWMPWRTTVARLLKSVPDVVKGKPLPVPKYGPPALTYFAKTSGVARLALPVPVLYPFPIKAAAIARAYEPGFIESLVTPETVCVHLWRTTFVGIHGLGPPRAGWLKERAEQLLPSSANTSARP
jgi:hypothetical protein